MFKKEGKKKTHIYLYFVVYRKIEGLKEDKNILKKKKKKVRKKKIEGIILFLRKRNFHVKKCRGF